MNKAPTPRKSKNKHKHNDATHVHHLHAHQWLRGEVSQVDPKTKSFTLTSKGKKYKFFSFHGGVDLKIGAVVDVTYTVTLKRSEP